MKNRMSVSYWVELKDTHSVEVKAWFDTKWNWNIYAHIFEASPLFNNVDEILNIPMHGGITLDRDDIKSPMGGIKYEWQRLSKSRVIGCDYGHIYDDYDNHPSPFDMPDGDIPFQFKRDAEEVARYINEKTEVLGE